MIRLKTKTVEEKLYTNKELNNSLEVSDSDFKNYKIAKLLNDADPEAIVLDGFNDAIVGTTSNGRLVYDIGLIRKILMQKDKMKSIDADEYLDFYVLNAFFGSLTPIYVNLNIDLILQSLK